MRIVFAFLIGVVSAFYVFQNYDVTVVPKAGMRSPYAVSVAYCGDVLGYHVCLWPTR